MVLFYAFAALSTQIKIQNSPQWCWYRRAPLCWPCGHLEWRWSDASAGTGRRPPARGSETLRLVTEGPSCTVFNRVITKHFIFKKNQGQNLLRLYWTFYLVCNGFAEVTYPGGSGVKAKLLCDGEFSGVSICWYSSVHVFESHLGGKGYAKVKDMFNRDKSKGKSQ